MTLSVSQLAAVKADIIANSDLNILPNTDDGNFAIAALYNVVGAQDVWDPQASVQAILNGVDYTKYTPVDAIPAAAADLTMLASNKYFTYLMACGFINVKQMNLQNLTIGRTTIDCTLPNNRAGLRDAVINIPAGANSAMISAAGASGVGVTAAMTRKATRFENLLASATTSTGATAAKSMTFIGAVAYQDITAARNS